MEAISVERKKTAPVMLILLLLFGVLMLGGIVGVGLYLDYHAGSQSSTTLPNGMEVAGIARGFGAGSTAIGSVHGDGVPLTLTVRVEGREFEVTETEVLLNDEQISEIPESTKQLSIVSYRGATYVEADGAEIATLE